jgi:ABC-type methionine transport system ATPase subunit
MTQVNVRVRLTFPEHLIKEPIVARMVKQFDVTPNIRRASVEETFGWIVCEIGGESEAVDRATRWLSEVGVQVHHLGDVVES